MISEINGFSKSDVPILSFNLKLTETQSYICLIYFRFI